jgi:hypothetical protein
LFWVSLFILLPFVARGLRAKELPSSVKRAVARGAKVWAMQRGRRSGVPRTRGILARAVGEAGTRLCGTNRADGDDAMKKMLISLLPAFVIAGCSGFGGPETLTGEINSIDRDDRLVTIDGERYQIDEDVQISNLDEGDRVTITVENDDPYDLITDID